MNEMIVKFLGSGDAFGSGGRFQSCIMVEATQHLLMLDCGASSMIALNKSRVNPNDIALIMVTNLHGDHFGGIPYFIIDARLNRKRTEPLIIAGPSGMVKKFPELMEATFPGSADSKFKFSLELIELEPLQPWQFHQITVTSFPVVHAAGDPHQALRITCGDQVLAYSGDTEWTESLVSAGAGADLFILESYFYDKKARYHLDYETITANQGLLDSKRLVITHMSENMLDRLDEVRCDYAEDGKIFVL